MLGRRARIAATSFWTSWKASCHRARVHTLLVQDCRIAGVLRAVVRDLALGEHVLVVQDVVERDETHASQLFSPALRLHHFAIQTD